jgi:hypothetical protein
MPSLRPNQANQDAHIPFSDEELTAIRNGVRVSGFCSSPNTQVHPVKYGSLP